MKLGRIGFFWVCFAVCTPVIAVAAEYSSQNIGALLSLFRSLGWDEDLDTSHKDFFDKLNNLNKALEENLEELGDNAKAMEENEQSKENKMLTAATTAATGIGGMELARGLAEQNADKDAEQNMGAYLTTFRCKYGDAVPVKVGPDEIELPGGNDSEMAKLRNEYFALANDLKERKTALGMNPGIESQEILDKSQTGLYDDESVGIDGGAYASLYRAQVLKSEQDQQQIDEEKQKSENRVKYGATAAVAGAAMGIVGNQMLNRDKHDKSAEILAKRKEILNELDDIIEFELNECNAKIQEENEGTSPAQHIPFLTQKDDIYKLADHPVCY